MTIWIGTQEGDHIDSTLTERRRYERAPPSFSLHGAMLNQNIQGQFHRAAVSRSAKCWEVSDRLGGKPFTANIRAGGITSLLLGGWKQNYVTD